MKNGQFHSNNLRTRSAFTLIELIVVLAITLILFGLVFGPLIQGFNFTQRARTQIETQTGARQAMYEINRTLGNAALVYDNTRSPIILWVSNNAGVQKPVSTRFTMVEATLPGRQQDETPGAALVDPTTGLPYNSATGNDVKSGYALPLAPGRSLVRFFIGLQDNTTTDTAEKDPNDTSGTAVLDGQPTTPYFNSFESNGNATDNRYALFRAEVMAYVTNPDKTKYGTAAYVPNLGLFHTAADPSGKTDTVNGTLIRDDANFFYDNSLAGGDGDIKWAMPGWKDLAKDGKVHIWENWRAVATAMMATSKLDAIALSRDNNNNPVFDVNGLPTVRPLITFSPGYFPNDPAIPNTPEAAADVVNPSPTAYRTQSGHWAAPYQAYLYRGANALSANPLIYYVYARNQAGAVRTAYVNNAVPGLPPPDPFAATDVGPVSAGNDGYWTNGPAVQMAFNVDSEHGVMNNVFPSTVMVYNTAAAGSNVTHSPVPSRYSPWEINDHADPASPVGSFLDAGKVSHAYGARFLMLTAVPQYSGDSADSIWKSGGLQLNPAGITSPLDPTNAFAGYVRIVPGSEMVFGPDMRPGAHYGTRVQYSRVPSLQETVGQNQYKIYYDTAPNAPATANDPRLHLGYVEFDSAPDNTNAAINVTDGWVTDPTDNTKKMFVFKPHGLPVFRYDPNQGNASPADPVEVYYSFQLNQPTDVAKVDYLSRSIMNVSLQARMYDPATDVAQVSDLSMKIKVRNML